MRYILTLILLATSLQANIFTNASSIYATKPIQYAYAGTNLVWSSTVYALISDGVDDRIDTGFGAVDSADWWWEWRGSIGNLTAGNLQGVNDLNDLTRFYVGQGGGGYWRFGYKTSSTVSATGANTNINTHRLCGNGKYYVNDILVDDKSAVGGGLTSSSIDLFNLNIQDVPALATCVYSTIVSNGVTLQYLVARPAGSTKYNSTPMSENGFRDRVTGEEFINQGTGEFGIEVVE